MGSGARHLRGRLLTNGSVLDAIGNTSMVRLRKVVPPGCAGIFAKLEWENPTGSMKDRMALAVIARAEADGRLKPGDTVVEYTGGSTGASLALVCAAKGYRIRIVTSDAFSQEKRDHMAALGAELTLVPSEGGLTTKKLILDMIEAARELAREPQHLLDRPAQQPGQHRRATTRSARRSGPRRRARSTPSSTASAPRPRSRGVAAVLKRHNPESGSSPSSRRNPSVLLGGAAGAAQDRGRRHRLRAAALGPVGRRRDRGRSRPTTRRRWRGASRARRRSSRAPRPAPTSSRRSGWRGGSGPAATVVTLMADSGLKYLSTDVYRLRS